MLKKGGATKGRVRLKLVYVGLALIMNLFIKVKIIIPPYGI
jgi:hypothetical protein